MTVLPKQNNPVWALNNEPIYVDKRSEAVKKACEILRQKAVYGVGVKLDLTTAEYEHIRDTLEFSQ